MNSTKKFNDRLDKEVSNIEKKLDQETNLLGYIKKSTVISIIKPFTQLLKQFYAESISNKKNSKKPKKLQKN